MFRSILTISFFISLSRVFGFARDVLIAKYVGVTMLSDVFFAAFRLPNFFRRVFAEGAFNSAFVPIFIERSVLLIARLLYGAAILVGAGFTGIGLSSNWND